MKQIKLSQETEESIFELRQMGRGHHLACTKCEVEEGAVMTYKQSKCKHNFIPHILGTIAPFKGKCVAYVFKKSE